MLLLHVGIVKTETKLLWVLRHLVLINTRLSDFNQFIKLTNFVFHQKSKKREKQHQMEKEKAKSCFKYGKISDIN